MNWASILLAAVSGYYFGWKKGHEEEAGGIKPTEVVVSGTKIAVPQKVYQIIQGQLPSPTKVSPIGF